MAWQRGIFGFDGTIGGVTFYKSKYGLLARKKGGPTLEQVKFDPKFERTRENGREFGNCAGATKLLRQAIRPLLKQASDFKVTGRLNKLMIAIKTLDTISTRGSRNVAIGIGLQAGKDLMKGFDFNSNAPLKNVLKKTLAVNTSTGVININGLIPKQDADYPQGATHLKLTGAWVKIDFGNGIGERQDTNSVVLAIDGTSSNVLLTPVAVPGVIGTDLFILQLLFFQEVNGVQYELRDGEFNAMGVVGVG